MADTIVEQVRTAIEPTPGTVKYRITATVTDAGDLPFKELFVFKINDPVDDSDDTFERVANPNDLQNITPDRVTAVANGESYFLWSVLVRDYIDVEVAVQAIAALEGRINTAVSTWITYQTEFEGTEIDTYPSADEELADALKADYATKKAARVSAEADVTTAETNLELAEGVAELAVEKVAIYEKEIQFCSEARAVHWAAYYSGVGVYKSGMKTFFDNAVAQYNLYSGVTYPDVPSSPNDWIGLHGVLQSAGSAQAAFNSVEPSGDALDTALLTFCNAASTSYGSAVSEKSAADQDVANKVTAKEEAEAALASAQTAEDEALAAVLNICPDFDPDSV
jgi:hypothetical protein